MFRNPLGAVVFSPEALLKRKLIEQSGMIVPEGVVTEQMQTRQLTICDPTGEWIWTGAKVMEAEGANQQVWEGVWRKRLDTDPPCGDVRFMETEMLALGPIMFPANATSYAFQWEGALPSDWQQAINETIARDCDSCLRNNMRSTATGHVYGRLRPFLGDGLPAEINQQFVSFDDIWGGIGDRRTGANVMTREAVDALVKILNEKGTIVVNGVTVSAKNWTGTYEDFVRRGLWQMDLIDAFVVQRPDAPVFLAKHPVSGKEYGVFMSVVRRDVTKEWDSTTNPYVIQFVWRPINKSWVTKAWEWVKHIVVKVIKFGKGMFCALASSQTVTEAAMKSGNPYAMAGGAGAATLAPMLCTPKTQVCPDGSTIDINAVCPIPAPGATGSKAWMWIVGGFALLGGATYLLTKPKPKKKPLPART